MYYCVHIIGVYNYSTVVVRYNKCTCMYVYVSGLCSVIQSCWIVICTNNRMIVAPSDMLANSFEKWPTPSPFLV